MAEVTVLYDEGCGFCTRLALRLAGSPAISAAPIGSVFGTRMLRDLSPAERYASVHAVDGFGRRSSAGAAVPALLRELPGGFIAAGICAAFPGLTGRAYGLVARNRGLVSRLTGLWQEPAVCR